MQWGTVLSPVQSSLPYQAAASGMSSHFSRILFIFLFITVTKRVGVVDTMKSLPARPTGRLPAVRSLMLIKFVFLTRPTLGLSAKLGI
jgi:hypothetical protein